MAAASCCRFCPSKIGSSGVQRSMVWSSVIIAAHCVLLAPVKVGSTPRSSSETPLLWLLLFFVGRDLWRLWCRFMLYRRALPHHPKILPRRRSSSLLRKNYEYLIQVECTNGQLVVSRPCKGLHDFSHPCFEVFVEC